MAAADAAARGDRGDRGANNHSSPSSSSSSSCWFVLFLVQTAALVWKNVLMATRNWRATATQLAAPLLFVLVIFVVDVGVRASRARQPAFLDVRRSTPEAIRHIPDCEKDAFVMRNSECLDFAYAPAGNVHADALAANIAANNQPPIPQRRYRGFPDEASIDAYLLNHPNEVLGAVIFHFDDDDNNSNNNNNNNNLRINSSSSSEVEVVPVAIDYTLQTNSSVKFWRGEFRDPNTFAQLPLQVATEREIVRYLGNQARRSLGAVEDDQLDLTWNIALRTFPHPAAVAPSIVGGIAPGFLFAATMFSFVLVASNVVHERELQLRQGMESMGMLLSSYWTSWILWEGFMNVVSSGIITATGYLLGFSLFVKNSQALLFVVFFTFQNAMLAFALLISVFTKTSQGATSLSFGIFIIGWIFQSTVLFGFPYQPQYKSDVLRVIFNLLPWNPFTKAITDLGAATMTLPSDGDGFGITWRRRFAYCVPPSSSGIETLPQSSSSHSMLVDSPTNTMVGTGASAGHYTVGGCYLSVGEAIVWMSVMFFVFAFLAAYLDQIVPNSYGTRRPFYYFLMPNYWCARRSRVCQTSSSCCGGGGGGGEEEGGGKDGEPTAAEAAGRNNNDKMMSNRTKAALRASLATPPLAQRVSSHNVDEDVEAEEQRARLHARILLAKAGERDGGGDGGDDSARADGSSLLEENVPQSSALPPPRFATIGEGEEELGQQQQQQRAAIELFGLGKTYTLPPSSASGPQDPIEEEESAASTRNRLRRPTAMSRIRGCLSRWFCCLCASLRRKRKIKVAVGGTWLQLETGKVFALLGPNGAGKTTTIHMLTGLVVPTNGDANILGNSLVGAGGVDRVRQISGVCPQFDILWNQLTGIEHMRLFYALKGLWAQNLDHEHSSRALLERVKLDKVASRRTETYSGGMRRRLSVAIAMLGNPPVVYLDEPTTGMDPVSRRYVWDIIDEYKRNACVVLTTHSMEEADVLGDRVGIMSRGYLQVLGTSLHLKNRFGAGYRISVALEGSTTTMSKRKAELKRIVESTRSDDEMVAVPLLEEGATRYSMEGSRSMRGSARYSMEGSRSMRGSDQKYGSYEHFVVPREEKRRLPDLFARLDECRVRLGIADVQVNLSPLEEVFLQVTTKEEES